MTVEITRDMLPFLLVMGVLIVGFSGAFYILFTPSLDTDDVADVPDAFLNYHATLLSTFLMILGDFDIAVFKDSTPHREMAILMLCAYQLLGTIVLLNLLIAIMGDTFARVKDMEALHFWKGRAAVIDEIELAQQIGKAHSVESTARYLQPHLHTLRAVESKHDADADWLREAVERLEKHVSVTVQALQKVRTPCAFLVS